MPSRSPAPSVQGTAASSAASGRAKPLTRPRSALEAAIVDAGTSKRAVAESLGIREHIVREICAGSRAMTEARFLALPLRVRTAYLARLAEAPPPSGLSLDQHVMRDGEIHGLSCAEARTALLDGVVDIDELRRIRAAVYADVTHGQQWLADLDREIAKRGGT